MKNFEDLTGHLNPPIAGLLFSLSIFRVPVWMMSMSILNIFMYESSKRIHVNY